ncbi:MAG TPA: dipeptidase PepE [Vicinamibacteria bacterium]|nr:dipeptidase PepE [Vicinamibacteria bacterium]
MRRLLLLSNSTNHGERYLDHAMPAIRALLGAARRLAFVPFALRDQEGYVARARARFAEEDVEVRGVTADESGKDALEEAEAVFIGGGNTFRLLDRLQRSGLLGVVRRRALAGVPYLGASAGTNVATPTLKTTNDMPIVQPVSFEALGLVPFQINPHYLDPDPSTTHMGETSEDRIREFHEENAAAVVGLREGGWLEVQGARGSLRGPRPARLFRRGGAPVELAPGAAIDDLL